jgi:hypothetical protein
MVSCTFVSTFPYLVIFIMLHYLVRIFFYLMNTFTNPLQFIYEITHPSYLQKFVYPFLWLITVVLSSARLFHLYSIKQ